MTPRLRRLVLAFVAPALLGLATCVFTVDPDKDRFSCASDADCGPKYECRFQLAGGGLCYPIGQCVAEVCDGQDNDCNGVADDVFDLQTDVNHCGSCGHACGAGNRCVAGACAESNCGNALDDDGDGRVDCADPDCANQPCTDVATFFCVPPLDADGGTTLDGGTADAGTPDGGAPGTCAQRR